MLQRNTILIAVMLGLSIVAAACQTSTPPATATPSPVAAASSPDPTVGPSPTAPVSQAFLAQIVAATRGQMALSGTLELGAQLGDVRGALKYVGGDSEQTMTISIAGVTSTTATIHVAGEGFTRTGTGPWFKDLKPPTSGSDLGSTLKALSSLVDKGVEEHYQVQAHRIELPTGATVPAAAFGLTDPAMKSPTVSLVFYAADDGKPLGMVVTASWTQTANGTDIPVKMTLDLEYTAIGGSVIVDLPLDIWQRFTSKRYHYKVAVPGQWDVITTSTGYDRFESPTETFVVAGRYKTLGFSLNAIAKGLISYDKSHYKWTSNSNVSFTLAGVKARLLTFHGTLDDGKKYVIYEVVAVKGSYWYDVVSYSLKGQEATDLTFLKKILATYAFA